ncbi:MAG: LysM peptidoglycan-binding domain-containing protein [Gammaproteobacteria bacterium]|nr:MAG: LysM peptidoglycan-binding domain-containing protein [Gammaproteobacteria bacterium]
MKNNLTIRTLITLLLSSVLFLAGCASTKTKETQSKNTEPSLSELFGGSDAPDQRPSVPKAVTPHTAAPREYQPKEVTYTTEDFSDLWDRIRAGYALPAIKSRHIAEYERWYSSRPEYVERLVRRATPYLYYVATQVESRNMPMEIALLPAIESAYKPNALSSAKAVGLWQFIPATGRHYGLKQNWWYDGRKDIYSSTRSALDYLEKLNRDFDGDWALALASYNAGEGTISRAIVANQRAGKPTDYTSLKLRNETRRYVPKLIALSNIIKDPEKYGLKIASVPNEPYFSVIRLSSQIDLGVVADAANIPVKELQMLNPGFKRWATDPAGPHRLLVNASTSEMVADAIAGIPQHKRVRWAHFKVKKGDSLGLIAHHYRLSVASIKKTNNLKSDRIIIGQDLLIPVSSSYRKGKRSYQTTSFSGNKSSKTTNNTSQQTPKIISVRKGDTLWSLSRRYKVTLNELTEWNKINASDMLFSGQKLKIWRY